MLCNCTERIKTVDHYASVAVLLPSYIQLSLPQPRYTIYTLFAEYIYHLSHHTLSRYSRVGRWLIKENRRNIKKKLASCTLITVWSSLIRKGNKYLSAVLGRRLIFGIPRWNFIMAIYDYQKWSELEAVNMAQFGVSRIIWSSINYSPEVTSEIQDKEALKKKPRLPKLPPY